MGVKESASYCSLGNSENFADFFVGHPLNVIHGNDGSMIFRQLLQGLVQSFLKLGDSHLSDGVALGGQFDELLVVLDVAINIVQTHALPALPFLQEIEGHIDRNGVNPGVKRGLSAKSFEGAVGLGEDVLEKVVCVLVIRGHVVDEAVQFGGILHHELVKSGGVSLF
jgi:hypothetical protein